MVGNEGKNSGLGKTGEGNGCSMINVNTTATSGDAVKNILKFQKYANG